MPRREFQSEEGDVATFWIVEWKKDTYSVSYGTVGTEGKTQTRKLRSADDVSRFCEKLIAEKLKKGYVEHKRKTVDVKPTKTQTPQTRKQPVPDDVLAKCPKVGADVAAPTVALIQESLQLLEVPEELISKFPSEANDLVWSFAEAVADSPISIQTDWRFGPSDVLNDVWQRIYPHGVKGCVEEVDESTDYPKKIILEHDGIGSRFRVRNLGEEPCLHEFLFALERILPADLRFFSVIPFESTDTYIHLIQSRANWLKVYQRLGPWFWTVFSRHDAPVVFSKIGGDVQSKPDRIKKYTKKYERLLSEGWHSKREAESRHEIACLLDKRIDDPSIQPRIVGLRKSAKKQELAKWQAEMESPRRLRFATQGMNSIAKANMLEGVVSVLKGNNQGWESIEVAFHFQFLAIRVGLFFQQRNIVDEGAKIIALAWTLGHFKAVDWLCQDLLQNPGHFDAWDFNPLTPFLLQLHSVWKGYEIEWAKYPKAKMGVYAQVFRAWSDPYSMAYAIKLCCDYHLMRTGESGFQEFCSAPFEVFPIEVLAIYRTRRSLGLETPLFSHELLDTPLGKVPKEIPPVHDELLPRIVSIIESESPELGEELKLILFAAN